MNLHRSGREGQWKLVHPDDQNKAQQIAEKTNGIVTPANAVSIAGGGLVIAGLRDVARGDTSRGIVKIGVGRFADVLDGTIADKTGTKSPTGEAVDVVVDKAVMAAALPVMVKQEVLPLPAAGIILAQNLANATFSAVAKRRGPGLQPSKEGKLATFGQWTSIGLYGLAAMARQNDAPKAARGLEIAGHISTIATAALGAKAIAGYAQETLAMVSATEARSADLT